MRAAETTATLPSRDEKANTQSGTLSVYMSYSVIATTAVRRR